jgi:hypothetical protein
MAVQNCVPYSGSYGCRFGIDSKEEVTSMTRATSTLVALALLALTGCARIQPQPDPGYHVPAAVLQDPYERMMAKEQMRANISRRTMYVSSDQYRADLRPQIARELAAAGFAPADVADILAQIDETRAAVKGDESTQTAKR